MRAFDLTWSHGAAVVLDTAAMLADCRFDLPGGPFRPFARAPWMGTVEDRSIIGHLRELGGDFACVPFGAGRAEPVGPPEWAKLMAHPPQLPIHGPAGDADWDLVAQTASSVTLALDYPADHIVRRLERTVMGVEGSPTLASRLVIHPRRSGRISAGLHPILRLPDRPGRLELQADFSFGLVHPGHVAAGQSGAFDRLDAVTLEEGTVDLGHLPFGRPNLNAQLCGMTGPLRATYLDEGVGVELDWDRSLLPSLQIWCTDRGIDAPPWHGRYRGVGVEPVASAFDLGDALSVRPNPISRRGVATCLELVDGVPLVLPHSLRAFAVAATA